MVNATVFRIEYDLDGKGYYHHPADFTTKEDAIKWAKEVSRMENYCQRIRVVEIMNYYPFFVHNDLK